MTRSVSTIDAQLRTCQQGLATAGDSAFQRANILALIDGLLDERLATAGRLPDVVPPTVLTECQQLQPCNHCYQPAPVRAVPPAVVGAVQVHAIDCPRCDRRRCKCGALVAHRGATKCPTGHWLPQ